MLEQPKAVFGGITLLDPRFREVYLGVVDYDTLRWIVEEPDIFAVTTGKCTHLNPWSSVAYGESRRRLSWTFYRV